MNGASSETTESSGSHKAVGTMLGLAYLVSYFSLFPAAIGQALFVSPISKPNVPGLIVVMICQLPWLIVFTVTFTKQPFLPPRLYRYCLMFAGCWFATVTIIAEVLQYTGYIPSDGSQSTIARVLMHVGWLSLFLITVRCRQARRYELQYAQSQKA